jgi:hypothetical protein
VFTFTRYNEQEKIENRILSNLTESDCELIDLTSKTNDIHWEKEGEIFTMNGVMYDVAKKKNIGGNIYAYCITEENEMEILFKLSPNLAYADDSATDLTLVFSAEYTLQNCKSTIKAPLFHFSALSPTFCTPLTKGSKNILLPPPRFTVA